MEEELRENWCLLALLSRAPCSRPGLNLLSQNKQKQPRPCGSMRRLGWHSAYNAISRHRQGLPFCSGVQVDSGLGQCLPQPRGDATGSVNTARTLGWGVMGNSPYFPGKPLSSANASTSWRKSATDCPLLQKLFLRVQGRAPGGKHMSAPRTGGLGAALPLAQRHRTGLPSAQTFSSEWTTRTCPSGPLLSP